MKLAPVVQSLLFAVAVAAYVGCAQSQSLDDPPGADASSNGPGGDQPDALGSGIGSAGSGGAGGGGGIAISGSAGALGTGGAAGTGGTTGATGIGGTLGLGGRGGAGLGGRAGTSGFGGRGGSAGAAGSGGRGGRGGTTGTGAAGGSSAGGTGGAAPTFTEIYENILLVSCGGSNCHNPGSQRGVGFASQASAYSAVSKLVTPGNGAGSSFYTTVSSGAMPPGGPRLSAANLALIKAWIDAGALDN
jgi:hypothetical protein